MQYMQIVNMILNTQLHWPVSGLHKKCYFISAHVYIHEPYKHAKENYRNSKSDMLQMTLKSVLISALWVWCSDKM